MNAYKEYLKRLFAQALNLPYDQGGIAYALWKHLREESNISVVDVGAHRGDFTHAIDRLCGISRGVLLELQPNLAADLERRFPSPRFRVVAGAICDRLTEFDVEVNEFDATTSILKTRRDMPELMGLDVRRRATVRVPATTLDLLLKEEKISHFDLLKLDVQGAEHLVIAGGSQSLLRTRMVWTEVSFVRLYDDAVLFQEVHQLLRNLNFHLIELQEAFRSPNGEILQADALFSRQ